MSVTLTTLAGLQYELLVGDIMSKFRLQAALLDSVSLQDAGNAKTVRFNSRAVPNSASSHTENASLSAVAVTVGAQDAALAEYPILTRTSLIAWGSGDPSALTAVSEDIAGGLARTADVLVCNLFDDVPSGSGAVSASLTINTFWSGSAYLDATGYTGRKVAVFHPQTFVKIADDLLGYYSNIKGNEFITTGKVANVAGIDIFVSPWVKSTQTANDDVYNYMGFDWAIGFGHRTPLVDLISAPNPAYAAVDVLGIGYFAAKNVNPGGSYYLIDNIG